VGDGARGGGQEVAAAEEEEYRESTETQGRKCTLVNNFYGVEDATGSGGGLHLLRGWQLFGDTLWGRFGGSI
jgi:hypothetical protein